MALELRDSAGALLTEGFALADLMQGALSAEIEVQVWNTKGDALAPAIPNVLLVAREKSSPSSAAWLESGLPFVDNRWIEFKVVEALGTAQPLSHDWLAVGAGVVIPLGELPGDGGYRCMARVRPGVAAPVGQTHVSFGLKDDKIVATSGGLSQSTGDGILTGIGDASWSQLLYGDLAIQNPAGADDQVELQDTGWVGTGRPWAKVKRLLQLSNLDGDGNALLADETYLAQVTLAPDGTDAVTKSPKGTEPLPASAEPKRPAGHEFYVLVNRAFDGLIQTGDITDRRRMSGFHLTSSGASPTVTLSAGRARVDNALAYAAGSQQATLPLSTTSYVWLSPTGGLEVTSSLARSSARPLPLYQVTTDGTGVTAVVDLRRWVGGRQLEFMARFDATLVAAQKILVPMPFEAGLALSPLHPLVAMLTSPGSGAGSTIFDLKYTDRTGALGTLASIFPSSGTEDRRPTIAPADALIDRDARPEVCFLPGPCLLEFSVAAIPATTAPDGALLTLRGQEGT